VSYIANKDQLQAKGVDQVIFIASNDHWVMSAWGKANGVKDNYIVSPPAITLKSP
jgi:alkyl hydroperoxide reductase 1